MDIKELNSTKFKYRANSWKDLVRFGVETPEGLLIPTGLHGLKKTQILFDYEDEVKLSLKMEAEAKKKHKDTIILVGTMY